METPPPQNPDVANLQNKIAEYAHPPAPEGLSPELKAGLPAAQDQAAAQALDLLTMYPTLKLTDRQPIAHPDGTTGEMVTSPLVDRMRGVKDELLLHMDGRQSGEIMGEIADLIVKQKTGAERLPDEVEGAWTNNQVTEFRRGLAMYGVLPPETVREPQIDRGRQILDKIRSFVPSLKKPSQP